MSLELQQKKSSKAEQVRLICTKQFPLTEPFSEKYLKKLIRNTDNGSDIEDGLKRLDRLTQEEVQMASAQLLKVTNTINNRVEKIADNILGVDNRVASVGGQVQGIDEKVTVAMDGTCYIFYLSSVELFHP